MIYIVHGNDYAKSRKLIINQLKKHPESIKKEINLSEITPKELIENIATKDIFGNVPFIVINLDQNSTNLSNYISVLEKAPTETPIILLSVTNIPKNNELIKRADDIKAKIIQNEKTNSANIFKFVDFIFSGQKKAAYKELNLLLNENNDPFYIFSMILNGLRNVLHAKHLTQKHHKKSSFIKNKASNQAKNFSEKNLITAFELMYNTDLKIKTGKIDPETFLVYTIEKLFKLQL